MAVIFRDEFTGTAGTLLSARSPDLTPGPGWTNAASDARWKLGGVGTAVPGLSSGLGFGDGYIEIETPAGADRVVVTADGRMTTGSGSMVLLIERLTAPGTTAADGNVQLTCAVGSSGGHLVINTTLASQPIGGSSSSSNGSVGTSDAYVTDQFHEWKVEILPAGGIQVSVDGAVHLTRSGTWLNLSGGSIADYGYKVSMKYQSFIGGNSMDVDEFTLDMGTVGPEPPSPSDFWTGFVNTREVP